jgi:DEAD/DEAH box helicase domain-containing protein
LETQKLAHEVGGWKNISKMGLSIAITYSEDCGFRSYNESQICELLETLKNADAVVGYNHIRFDYEVLKAYVKDDLTRLQNIDMLLEIQKCLGFRLKLDNLAQATIGRTKIGDGLDAPKWFREGKLDLLEKYCKEDVALTRDLFQFGAKNGYLLFENKQKAICKVAVGWGDYLEETAGQRYSQNNAERRINFKSSLKIRKTRFL